MKSASPQKSSTRCRLTNGNYQLVVEGQNRAERMQVSDADGYLVTRVHIRDISELRDDTENDRRLIREAWAVFNEYLKYVQRPSQDIVAEARKITDPGLLADCLGQHVPRQIRGPAADD